MNNIFTRLKQLFLKFEILVKRPYISALIIVLLAENVILAYNNLQNKTPILGLRFENKNITGAQYKGIEKLVDGFSSSKNTPIKLTYGSSTFVFKPSDIGYKINKSFTANSLLQEGRKGTIFQKFITQHLALLGLVNKHVLGNPSPSLLTVKLLEIQDEVNRDATPVSVDFKNDPNKVIPAKDGVKVQIDKLNLVIINAMSNPSPNSIQIPTYKVFPTMHDEKELQPLIKKVPELTRLPISITAAGKTFTLSSKDLLSLLTIAERPDPSSPKKTRLVLRLNDRELNQKLGDFAATVEEVTHAEFNYHDARVAIFSQFYTNTRKTYIIPTGLNQAPKKVLGAKTDGQKAVYLTFDDGPNSIYHPLILNILKTYNVKATFFLIGQNAKNDYDIAKKTFTDGHVIGNHSLTHSFLPKYSAAFVNNELAATDDILKPINNGKIITLFRPPYGGVNYTVTKTAQNLGLTLYLWDVDPRDWSEPPTDELVRRVVNNAHDGADILMHSNHISTVKALPKIIEGLIAQGYIFKTLQ